MPSEIPAWSFSLVDEIKVGDEGDIKYVPKKLHIGDVIGADNDYIYAGLTLYGAMIHGWHGSSILWKGYVSGIQEENYSIGAFKYNEAASRYNETIRVLRWKCVDGGIDLHDVMHEFIRVQALNTASLWDMPKIVYQYLTTKDPDLYEDAYASFRMSEHNRLYSYAPVSLVNKALPKLFHNNVLPNEVAEIIEHLAIIMAHSEHTYRSIRHIRKAERAFAGMVLKETKFNCMDEYVDY